MHERRRAQLAAAFAMSNMGHQVPADIAKNPDRWPSSVRNAVENLCGHLMETDEHEDIFADEADMWATMIDSTSTEQILRTHGQHCPWIKKILDVPEEALNPAPQAAQRA